MRGPWREAAKCVSLSRSPRELRKPPHPWPPLGRACVATFLCLYSGSLASLLGITGPAIAPGRLGLGSHQGTS